MTLILDALLILLLLGAIGLGVRVHLDLRRLRADGGELERQISAFAKATERAQSVLDELNRAADDTARRLAADLDRAQRLLDDLRFLEARGEPLADRLEAAIRGGRPAAGERPPPPEIATPSQPGMSATDLEQALRTLR